MKTETLGQALSTVLRRLRAVNPYPSALNPYNGTLILITLFCIVKGLQGLLAGNFWFVFLFAFGVLTVIKGVKQPPSDGSRKVWLVTCLGQMTTTRVEKMTLFLDWIPLLPIIGHVEIDMKKENVDFPMAKPVICKDGKYVEVLISTTMVEDDLDDKVIFRNGEKVGKNAGEKAKEFINAGRFDGIKKALPDMFTALVQYIGTKYTSVEMEKIQLKITEMLLNLVSGKEGTTEEEREFRGRNSSLDDTRGFGIRFTKFVVIVRPPAKVIEARNELQVSEAKRQVDVVVTDTVNEQIARRYDLYVNGKKDKDGKVIIPATPHHKIPSLAEIRNMVLQEKLAADGKVSQVINEGGINMTGLPGSKTP